MERKIGKERKHCEEIKNRMKNKIKKRRENGKRESHLKNIKFMKKGMFFRLLAYFCLFCVCLCKNTKNSRMGMMKGVMFVCVDYASAGVKFLCWEYFSCVISFNNKSLSRHKWQHEKG